MDSFNNEKISVIDENTPKCGSLIRQHKFYQLDDSKCEKDDSSSDIDIIDNIDSLQSSFSSQWSVINPVVEVPTKNNDRRKSTGTQTNEDISRLLHMTTLFSEHFALVIASLLCFFVICYLSNSNEPVRENTLFQDLSVMLKELKTDIKQMKDLQDSDVVFNENITSIMTDITDMKLELQGLKEYVNTFKYNILEKHMKELQDHNQNLTNEVIKLRGLINESNNCRYNKENLLMLNHTIYNIIQEENNRIQEQQFISKLLGKDKQFSQNILPNNTVTSETNNKRENPKPGSCIVNWLFCRAYARNDQRNLNDPQRWQFLRAYGRKLLRWVDKNVFHRVEQAFS